MVRIVSWNVNGLRAVERKGALQRFQEKINPDIFFLQEIKGEVDQFGEYLKKHRDWLQFYHSAEKKGYAGTGIWLRKKFAENSRQIVFSTEVPHLPAADEGRVSRLEFSRDGREYVLLSIYFPNGGKSEKAWRDKLIFYDRVLEFINELDRRGKVVIVGGDFNVAHREIDLARPKENDGEIGFHPLERAWMDRVLAAGWVDTWRQKHPDVRDAYTWWSHWTKARERNVGWRIDYILVHRRHLPAVRDAYIFPSVTGSDHAPVGIDWDEDKICA